MLLAKDGHEVTVLERDEMDAPRPAESWEAWGRRGVNQFRLPHFLLPRWRHEIAHELPELISALEEAGGYEFNFFGPLRDTVPDPERFDVLTARRPVFEAAIAQVAASTPHITICRGVGVAGLVTGASVRHGIPHVVGVKCETGDVVGADLVVAATGRRSALSRWLVDAGARVPYEEEEDSGLVYYGRHIRSLDGSQLVASPGVQMFGSIGLIQLPGDDGTAGIGLIGTSSDHALFPLRHEEAWHRVMRAVPGGAVLVDAEPISPVVSMSKIEDAYRRFVVDGEPVATGVVALADAWAATNPSLGRGISLGTLHAMMLRDVVREHSDDPYTLALAFDELTERALTPWYRATVWQDRNGIRDVAAEVLGESRPNDDPLWDRMKRLTPLLASDIDLAVRFVNSGGFLAETPPDMLRDPEIEAKLLPPADVPPHGGPTRAQLLDLVAG
jgi:2-polyprenyl-6-methoxyphenol hydroxylase-like FAD-dependent oxidoreductase